MFEPINPLLAAELGSQLFVAGAIVGLIVSVGLLALLTSYGALWFQAYMSGAHVSFLRLIGMSFRQIKPRMIVTALIMDSQAEGKITGHRKIGTDRLETHFLAGGDVMRVIRAIIAARVAGMDLDFDRAAAIDLAGRDVLDAVRISIFPKVIDCPDPQRGGASTLSAVAKNGVELRIRARVTVRTNLDQLVGGATEETIIARVGQGIISTIGGAGSHMEVLGMPSSISKSVLDRGLDANTAFEIVSIDIAAIDVGENIGARLQTDQAEADTRVARARAEVRLATAMALQQEMIAEVAKRRANYVLTEAEVPSALALAFRAGHLHAPHVSPSQTRSRRERPLAPEAPDQTSSPRPPQVDRLRQPGPIPKSDVEPK